MIGVRREDKNDWERRAPLAPLDVAELQRTMGLRFVVQSSPIRIFPDEAYRRVGVEVRNRIDDASLVFAIKEIPPEHLLAERAYVFFSHVIKGQPHNLPLLRRLMDLGCSLVDYERIVDEGGRRLLYFGEQAGIAGMVETLWCLGRRLAWERGDTPLVQLRHAYEYPSLEAARLHLESVGAELRAGGSDGSGGPLCVGVAGYGNVSKGCQRVLEWIGAEAIDVDALPDVACRPERFAPVVSVVFREEHIARPRRDGDPFVLTEYYEHPERYEGCFEKYLGSLDVLVNAIYWEQRYPRLVSAEWVRERFRPGNEPRLKVIGDIGCDIDGAVEITRMPTRPDAPCYVYSPETGEVRLGVEGVGPVVMAVDNLPCELPRESSVQFSAALKSMVPALAAANWMGAFDDLSLPPPLEGAVIAHRGELTRGYRYLEDHLEAARRRSR